MTGFLSTLLGRLTTSGPQRPATTAARVLDLGPVDGPVYAIGDIHGCRAELAALLDLIAQDAAASGHPPLIIPLGDMVDRGPDAAGTLDLLVRSPLRDRIRAILGNHECLMLDFLRDPHGHRDWLDLGGFETLRSYGLVLSAADVATMSRRRAQQTVTAHLPDDHVAWLHSLPHALSLRIGGQGILLSHAGYDTALPPDRQSAETLLWGRGGTDGTDALRLVQGHVIVESPDLSARRIRIDTGAWRTGRLTCLRLAAGDSPRLLAAPQLPSRPADKTKGMTSGSR